jgi:hypothetical protein|tara:strand:+ start:2596 stop:3045 length:450 start_codon:yes stop_codon:yes gene_type:complete
MELKILSFLIIIIILHHKRDITEYFKPNEKQYAICSNNQKGETIYIENTNELKTPIKGLFTSLLKSTNEKNHKNYFNPPRCMNIELPHHNYFNTNKIIDSDNSNTWKPLKNPFDKYQNPSDNYSVLYPNIFNDNFIKQHLKIIQSDSRF